MILNNANDIRRDKDRLELWNVVPLDTPFLVNIDPTNLCNAKCIFCPTGFKNISTLRSQGMMSWEVYIKIIDGLTQFKNKIKQFTFYKDGEPLLHPKFIDMVKYIKDTDIAEKIWVKTNGLRLCPDLNTKLVESGLDLISISLKHVNSEGFTNIAKVHIDYNHLLKNIQDLYKRKNNVLIYVGIVDVGLTDADKQKFYDDFRYISDYCVVEDLHGWSYTEHINWKLDEKTTYNGNDIVDKIVCPLVLHSMSFNWDGSVSICNEDWAWKTIIGNINSQTVQEIWNGQERLNFINMHLDNRRCENLACKNCHYIKVLPDNVDKYRTQMLEKINANR